MTDINTLCEQLETARAKDAKLTLKASEITALMRVSALVGSNQNGLEGLHKSIDRLRTSIAILAKQKLEEELITVSEVSEELGISRQSIWRLRQSDSKFPTGVMRGTKCIGFDREHFEAWKESRK